MNSIPRHENQHTAAMWWTVNHVASNQCGVREVGGMVVYIVLLLLFLFSLQHSFVSSSQLIGISIFVYPVCRITVLCFPLHLL